MTSLRVIKLIVVRVTNEVAEFWRDGLVFFYLFVTEIGELAFPGQLGRKPIKCVLLGDDVSLLWLLLWRKEWDLNPRTTFPQPTS